jgi:hypothetical protein
MSKKGTSTVFLLGIGGLGLSVAMLYDAITMRRRVLSVASLDTQPPKTTESKEREVREQKVEEEEERKEEEEEEEEKEEEEEDEEEEEEEKEEEYVGPLNYREMYLQYTRRKQTEYAQSQPDYSYRGDGSNSSKRLYFFQEAYRRSRQKTPINPGIVAAIKLKSLV